MLNTAWCISATVALGVLAPAPPWPVPSKGLWEPLSLGIDEDGNPVRIGLPERNQPGFLPRMIDGLLPVPKPQPAPMLPSRERVLTVPQPEPDNRAPQERQEKEPARQAIFD